MSQDLDHPAWAEINALLYVSKKLYITQLSNFLNFLT